jgi:hypothetical protein
LSFIKKLSVTASIPKNGCSELLLIVHSPIFHRISTYILRRRGPGLQNPNDQLTQHSHQDGDLDSLLNKIHIHEKELSLDVQGGKIKERKEELEE